VRPAPKITPKFVVAVVEQAREIATEEARLRIPSRLGMAVVIASVILMGWGLMRSTGAQDVPKITTPATSAAVLQDTEPKRVPDAAKPVETAAPPLESEVLPESSVPKLADTKGVEVPPPVTPAFGMPPTAPAATEGQNDDPEKTVQAFVEQNRKVAEARLKGLKDEEQKLRGRLQKVEGGIKRWEALLAALDKSSPAGSSKGLSLSEPRVRERPRVRPRAGAPSAPPGGPHELIEDLAPLPGTVDESVAPPAQLEKLPASAPR
jgi:hypothetical protein